MGNAKSNNIISILSSSRSMLLLLRAARDTFLPIALVLGKMRSLISTRRRGRGKQHKNLIGGREVGLS